TFLRLQRLLITHQGSARAAFPRAGALRYLLRGAHMDTSGDVRSSDPARSMTPELARVLADNHRRFLAFLHKRVGQRELGEEILQEAFVRGLSRADSLRDRESAVAWFYRVLRNALTDHFRRQGARARALEAAQHEPTQVPDEELMREACACVVAL